MGLGNTKGSIECFSIVVTLKSYCIIMTTYEKDIKERGTFHYILGLIIRWKQHIKYDKAVRLARKRGASIGENVVMPLSLARKANSNLKIGDHVSIQTDKIDLRNPVTIGNHVIIGSETEIITTSHNIDSEEWEHKHYGLTIEDFVWIPTRVMILPSCRKIEYGGVVSSGSVVVKNVETMSVVGGNPAKEFKKRKCVHKNLVVESLLGGDYHTYKKIRKQKT